MTYINLAREKGQSRWLTKYQSRLLKGIRCFGLSLSPLYIPIIVFEQDDKSGRSGVDAWLWTLVIFSCAVTFIGLRGYSFIRHNRLERENKEKEAATHNYDPSSVHLWSVANVAAWIEDCEELKTFSRFTEKEINAIARKFEDNKVDGKAFQKISQDEKALMNVGFAIGEALHFVDTMDKIYAAEVLPFPRDSELQVEDIEKKGSNY